MLWKEKGVKEGSVICFFNTDDQYKSLFYHMISCGLFHCDQNYRIENRGVRPPLFIYIVNGELQINYNGCHHTAPKGSIVLIDCRRDHAYSCVDDTEFLFFHFDGSDSSNLIDAIIENNGSPVIISDENRKIFDLINTPLTKLCYQEQTTDSSLSSLIYTVLSLLYSQSTQKNGHYESNNTDSIINSAIDYINLHINEPLRNNDIADHVGLSPYYFSRFFKKKTGFSPIDYTYKCKINYAKLMLRTTNSTIAQIAEALGYSSEASFINSFRHHRGISPQKYRKMADNTD